MNLKDQKKRALAINKKLKELFPVHKIALTHNTPWELLVAVILSAQSTDIQINKITETLFKKYRTLRDYTSVTQSEFEKDIFSSGFYRNKAKNILATAKIVQKDFKGRVPKTMEELLTLPGVARKTANIVLSDAYGIIEGIAVDTHVKRLTNKFHLTNEHDPKKIEKDLMELLPQKDWPGFSHRLIFYGREYCPARGCPQSHPLKKFEKV
ncbi:endonuclease III [Candidatus Wolfebacteria bacterium]|nr:MAG: endonuclease III [Candidatus Wolfebacteria bacterium]